MILNMDNGYMLNLPYPKININKTNSYYAKIILQSYAGMISEFTAISQYLYHKMQLFKEYPEISKVLLGISVVEMHHVEILGNLIVALGSQPRYWVKKKDKHQYWTPKFIDYGKTAKSMIKLDIEAEKQAIRQYEKSIKLIDDENINSIIRRIILDEELHIKILTGIYDKYFI